jgi:hypothetical protein
MAQPLVVFRVLCYIICVLRGCGLSTRKQCSFVNSLRKRDLALLAAAAAIFFSLAIARFPVSTVHAGSADSKAADAYEPDNMFEQAVVDRYMPNSTTVHNFFDQDDEDWSLLWIAGNTWLVYVQAYAMEANCVTTIEVYRLNPDSSLTLLDSVTSSPTAETQGYFLEAGTYYLRVTNSLGIYGDNTGYTLHVGGFDASSSILAALAGVVVNSADGDAPVPNATVKVERFGATSASADSNGIYSFPALPQQTYTATASAPGYNELSRSFGLGAGVNSQDFELVPIPSLSATPSTRNVSSASGQTTFAVANTGPNGSTLTWSATITAGSDWAVFNGANSGTNAKTVTLDYSENPTETARSATIEFTASGAANSPTSVTIEQAANTTPALDVQPATRNVAFSSGSADFTVSNTGFGNLSYSALVIEGNDWLSIAKATGGGTISANFAQNNTASERTGAIRVTATGAVNSPVDVSVVQAANTTPTLFASPSDQSVANTAGSTSFSVSNTGFGALTWDASVTSGGEWLSIQLSKVTGDGSIQANFTANDGAQRIGTITITAAGAIGSPAQVTVTQAASSTPVLNVTPSNQNVGDASGGTNFTVSNVGFGTLTWDASVTSGGDWLSIVASKITGGGTIAATFEANPSDVQRIGTITVTAPGANGSPIEVTVTQAGDTTPVLSVDPQSQNVGAGSGNTSFAVSNPGFGVLVWGASVTSGADWLSISIAKGSGGGTILAEVDANPSNTQREGTITVTGEGALGSPLEVVVTQAANTTPVLSVSPAQRNVGSASGTTSFDIANAGFGTLNWTADITSGGDWLDFVVKRDGTGAATVNLVFSTNAAATQRSATVTVTATGALNSPQEVTVVQAADNTPALEVSPRSREIGSDGAETTFNISNTGNGLLTWTAEVLSGDWATLAAKVDGSGNGTITVTCAENVSEDARLATIRVSADGAAGSPIDVTVLQSGIVGVATDLNGDSTIDAVDVQLIINAALGQNENGNADVDNDGDIDAVDIQLVINAALGL